MPTEENLSFWRGDLHETFCLKDHALRDQSKSGRGMRGVPFYIATEHISVFILLIYCQQTVGVRRL